MRYARMLVSLAASLLAAPVVAAPTMDAHVDTLSMIRLFGLADPFDPYLQLTPSRMEAGGLDAQAMVLWVYPKDATPLAMGADLYDEVWLFEERYLVEGFPEVVHVTSPGEVVAAAAAGQHGVILALEGADGISGVDELEALAMKGLLYGSLTWNYGNRYADGRVGKPQFSGVSPEGALLVEAMGELGVLVDVSHATEETFWDVVQLSRGPVIASHSNARALCDHPRNLDDTQLRAVAASGGVIGVTYYSGFLLDGTKPKASVEELVDHVVYLVDLVGAEHVALGSDFDGWIHPPMGLATIAELPTLAQGMAMAGLDQETIDGIMGGNLLRVWGDALAGTEPGPYPDRPLPRLVSLVGAHVSAGSLLDVSDASSLTAARLVGLAPEVHLVVGGLTSTRVALTLLETPGTSCPVVPTTVTFEAGGSLWSDTVAAPTDGSVTWIGPPAPLATEGEPVALTVTMPLDQCQGSVDLVDVVPYGTIDILATKTDEGGTP